jgi:hypothetical protein
MSTAGSAGGSGAGAPKPATGGFLGTRGKDAAPQAGDAGCGCGCTGCTCKMECAGGSCTCTGCDACSGTGGCKCTSKTHVHATKPGTGGTSAK